ncbi:MAG: hypothetical protein IKP69_08145 [Oscillospiraceae bacterium]|nr:hypothetical protein [Oscillospiraceae bacterium]
MRKAFEKKELPRSVRLSDADYNDFKETAKKEGKTFSAFMRDCAKHRNNSLEPRLVVHMQNVMNTAVELILRYEPQNTKTVEKLEKEMEELWDRLN